MKGLMQTQSEESFFKTANVAQLIDVLRTGVPAFPHFDKRVMLAWLRTYRPADYYLVLGSYFGLQVFPANSGMFCATLPEGAAEIDLALPMGPYASQEAAYEGACTEMDLAALFEKRCDTGQYNARGKDPGR